MHGHKQTIFFRELYPFMPVHTRPIAFFDYARFATVALVAPVEIPPSTSNVCPVMYRLSSEARKTTAPSRSFGCPGRLTGMRSQMYSNHSLFSYSTLFCSVRNQPGARQFTVIPCGPQSSARLMVSCF